MIHVTMNCSSPFVGYTIKTADCQQKIMLDESEKYLTKDGSRFFSVSGSQYLLATFEGRRYFHARNLGVEAYDEQNRRIYTNLAFVGDNAGDAKAIDNLAIYAMLQAKRFYKEFAGMICLEKFGYTVKFDELTEYLERFYGEISFEKKLPVVEKIYNAVYSAEPQPDSIVIVVFEGGDWAYFVKQAQKPLLKRALLELPCDQLKNLQMQVEIQPLGKSASQKRNTEKNGISITKKDEELTDQKLPGDENGEFEEKIKQPDKNRSETRKKDMRQKDVLAQQDDCRKRLENINRELSECLGHLEDISRELEESRKQEDPVMAKFGELKELIEEEERKTGELQKENSRYKIVSIVMSALTVLVLIVLIYMHV